MAFVKKRSAPTKETGEGDEDYYSDVETMDVQQTISTHEDLVGLIDQPAWKTILISLVKSEKMDPWDIDIKILAQKYLERIRSLQSTDLRLPANAILTSAILLKFKSRALRLPSIDDGIQTDSIRSLMTEEQLLGGVMPELVNPNLTREGKISLDQLVESIESILERTKTRVERERDARERPAFNMPFASMNVEEKMLEVMEMVEKGCDETGLARFNVLMIGKDVNEVIEYFLALLFLINEGKLNAWQESLFGEIFVGRIQTTDANLQSA